MITSRAIVSATQAKSQTAVDPGKDKGPAVHQDDQGPLDGELLDLYVAILIVVPAACVLRSLLL